MDQTGLKQPKSNLKWLWWGLGSFFALLLAFRIGAWSTGFSSDGVGKKVGIVHISGPIVFAEDIVKQLEKISNRITNEIEEVTWVSYVISSKPPATIEPQ